ncbi:S53 family peptidase [Mycolicibacterium sp. 050158]|uniref:S53 family peptidase n=1 Tax=Mycolicibacterium sp. 050158 TaxID=3090602 RepID=UPI00299EA939|nr:S53 family peptidase [Mycolicibacterium sp. 050158]MDX1891269.1 S53 family peptidase [Mycolicibacterium sp. 050158]
MFGRCDVRRHRAILRFAGICTTLSVAAAALVVVHDAHSRPAPSSATIDGPYSHLLTSSTDLGPSRVDRAQLTVGLRDSRRPETLLRWAADHELDVRWRSGEQWAIVEGAPPDVAKAFGVPVHDYRGMRGQVFYASSEQPAVPAAVVDSVSDLGRILGFTPHHEARPALIPLDVPSHGLSPDALLTAYNAKTLAIQGHTGKGQTIVFFAFSGYDQADLDDFASTSGLPPLKPILVGGQPGEPGAETTMDLEVAHAIAPDARMVVVNARPTLEGGRTYERIAEMFDSASAQYPGAVWSLSIGWGCEKLLTATDLKPVQAALVRAHAKGTSAFDATGDTAGLECKGGPNWSSPPGPDDIGLDAIASLPAITTVGGTTLSTDRRGMWLAEQAWFDSPLSQGTSGGVSTLFPRPAWQTRVSSARDPEVESRLTPDVSAVADPFTGVRIRFDGQDLLGAGTSQAAPIWAGLTALMNQYLLANGGRALGDLNPLLYRVAAGANSPGFRDVSLGANAVDASAPGYDTVTGLGTPNVDALVRDFLDIQRGVAPR